MFFKHQMYPEKDRSLRVRVSTFIKQQRNKCTFISESVAIVFWYLKLQVLLRISGPTGVVQVYRMEAGVGMRD